MSKKIGLIVAVVILVVAGVWSINRNQDSPASPVEGLTVAASFFIPEHFAEQVGGDAITIVDIGAAGSVHDFEPSPRAVASLQDVDVFLYHGTELDPWAERLAPELTSNGVRVVELTERLELLSNSEEEDDEHGHEDDEVDEEDADDHAHGAFDPHVWNNPQMSIEMVDAIRDAFIAVDPDNQNTYDENAGAYINELNALADRIRTGLQQCAHQDMIIAHDAFAYFAAAFDIDTHAISGISPEVEPSPQRLAELSELVTDLGLGHVYFETTSSAKTAETIASETGAETLTLHPLGGLTQAERDAGETYISIMNQNLENLQIGLDCQ